MERETDGDWTANYDDVAALVRAKAQAQAVLVIVVDGSRGSGFAVRVKGRETTPEQADEMLYGLLKHAGASAEQRRLGVERRDVKPADKTPGTQVQGLPELHKHEPGDDTRQRHLRLTVADEVEAVLKKHDVGGALLLVSEDAAAWRTVLPSWCGLQPDPEHVMRLRMKGATPEDRHRADCTMHFIAVLREMCSDYANLYGRLWRQAVDALKAQGATVEHAAYGGGKGVHGRPDPMGGKVQ